MKRTEIKLWQSNAISGVDLSKVSQSYHRFPKHFHDTYAVHLHESGTMIFAYGREEVALRPGSINLIHPGVVHSCLPGNEQPLSYRCLFLPGKFMDDYVISLGKRASYLAHVSLQDSEYF
ncbi:AraC family ligand binding domain-containing protein [Rhizobium sp. F40D2]|uniref:AraC family ligand binding domain-containing protein n=1 Tax=Rhizobium sp. F40D2 TaxID=3453141 RepID=UPI003F29E2CD